MRFFQQLADILEKYRDPRAFFSSKVTLTAAVLLSLFVSYHAVKLTIRAREVRRESAAIQRQIAEVRKEITELDKEIAQVHSRDVVERVAKEELNLKKPDEYVAVIVLSDLATTAEGVANQGFWEHLKSLIFFFR